MNDHPKTALELAMERLRQRDAEQGVSERPPTEDQKAAIAELRNIHAAKVAELEILHRSRIAGMRDPTERTRLEDGHRHELQRLADDRDRKIEKIRQP